MTRDHVTGNEHPVTITVNNKPVSVLGPKATGLEIKEAAVKAGLDVKLDFVLSEEHHGRPLTRVGDQDVVTVNPESKFTLVSPDHNS